jgi:hypothetical protein
MGKLMNLRTGNLRVGNPGTPKETPVAKILVQVKAAEADKVAIQDWPTLEAMQGVRRYRGIMSAQVGEMVELHLDPATAKALSAELIVKLAELRTE